MKINFNPVAPNFKGTIYYKDRETVGIIDSDKIGIIEHKKQGEFLNRASAGTYLATTVEGDGFSKVFQDDNDQKIYKALVTAYRTLKNKNDSVTITRDDSGVEFMLGIKGEGENNVKE